MMRRTIIRYLCLAQVLVLRDISIPVRRRFPTYESIVTAGLMLESEKYRLRSYKHFEIDADYGRKWAPINWAFALVMKARKAGQIAEIRKFRNCLQVLCNYDWVPVPLAYPQVHVTVPVITMLQYVFCMGWMKVATSLMNPFGADENDFEANYLIDKNIATCLFMVDEAHNDLPELKRDQFWSCDKIQTFYAKDAMNEQVNPLIGSAARARFVKWTTPSPNADDDDGDNRAQQDQNQLIQSAPASLADSPVLGDGRMV
ncbi:unnamed protein product [Anisakis simplex]|uniref:Bestrophin homolog n=1 Tax=Anisakis simplex TaxID=6269 RepID=A0A0M3JVY3_ANISI|nr:unnamed protein product [Anisakis simplex]